MHGRRMLALAAAAALTAAPAMAAEGGATAGTVSEVSAGKLAASPADYYGRRVRVTAEVEDVYDPHTFTLDEDQIGASPDVLVLVPAPAASAEDDSDVTVVGTVREFVRADLERDYDWLDFDRFSEPDLLVRIRTRPVIVAESVRTKDGKELVQAGGGRGAVSGARPGEAPGHGGTAPGGTDMPAPSAD